jgi:hypothetical protein
MRTLVALIATNCTQHSVAAMIAAQSTAKPSHVHTRTFIVTLI